MQERTVMTPSAREARRLYMRAIELSNRGDLPGAWRRVCEALELDLNCVEANVLAGDLWLLEWNEIGYEDHSRTEAAVAALAYFDHAVAIEPRYADAWAGKTRALLELGRFEEAVEAGKLGLAVLPERIGKLMSSSEVYRNVGEELYDGVVCALLALKRQREASKILQDALALYPDSAYLQKLVPRAREGSEN
jgi:tetratricopeptide (TPR) repeat protein